MENAVTLEGIFLGTGIMVVPRNARHKATSLRNTMKGLVGCVRLEQHARHKQRRYQRASRQRTAIIT
jgi:hypothetical protein